MNHASFLVARARPYWEQGQSLPLDLFAELVSSGMDVVALEQQYME